MQRRGGTIIHNLGAAAIFAACAPALAQGDLPPGPDGTQPDYYQTLLSEAEWDWRPGDLIFLNDLNSFDELLRQTEGGKWGSVGILRPSSGDPRVVFAHEDEGVTERILYELTDTRSGDEYVVYRLKDAETPGLGLMTNYLLLSAYGSPFDQVLLFGNGRFYGAELPFEAAMSEGHVIAAPQRLGDLADMNSPLVKTILADWPAHPYCVAALSITDCWQDVQNIAIITPGALLSSNRLVRVYP